MEANLKQTDNTTKYARLWRLLESFQMTHTHYGPVMSRTPTKALCKLYGKYYESS